MVRMVHRHAPQLPRALLGRPRMCREAGGGAALHAGGWTVAGTRAWGACVTYQASRAVAARLCCTYPEVKGYIKSGTTHVVSAHALSPCHLPNVLGM